jgi:hypothetical protein
MDQENDAYLQHTGQCQRRHNLHVAYTDCGGIWDHRLHYDVDPAHGEPTVKNLTSCVDVTLHIFRDVAQEHEPYDAYHPVSSIVSAALYHTQGSDSGLKN